MRQLYEALVPSVLLDEKGNPIEGTAQQAKPYCTPLMLKGSKGGKDAQKKIIEPLPKWVQQKKDGKENWLSESIEWINSNEGKAVLANFDKKSSWVKLGDNWQDAFLKDQEKQRKKIKAGGIVNILSELEQHGLIPLFSPIIKVKTSKKEKESVGAWNQLAFKKAIEHLLTWESWNHRCAKEYANLSLRVDESKTIVNQIDTNIMRKIEEYQSQRQKELKKHSLATDSREFKINPRMLRAFEQVKERWSKKDCGNQMARGTVLADLQTQLRGKFGDPDFYLWLAKDENTAVWQDSNNPLQEVAKLNTLKYLLELRKKQSLYTTPDAILHPKWAQFEAPGGTNLKNYKLIQNGKSLSIKLPLLSKTTDGIIEKEFTIPIAISGQINQPKIEIGNDSRLIFSYADEKYNADLGGSDIIFDREILEHRKLSDLQNGDWGKNSKCMGVGSSWLLILNLRHLRDGLMGMAN